MLKSGLCSINWGKGFAVLILMALLVVMISFWAVSHAMVPSQVDVDWGSIKSPACPPGQANCDDVAVDWGSIKSPVCPPGQVNCGDVAVDWGSKVPCNPNDRKCTMPPCDPKDPKCKPGPEKSVDWGS